MLPVPWAADILIDKYPCLNKHKARIQATFYPNFYPRIKPFGSLVLEWHELSLELLS